MVKFSYRGGLNQLAQRFLIIAVLAASLPAQTPASRCDFDAAVRLHQAGDLAGAAASYQACLAVEPGRVDARSNLGAVLARMGRYQDAIREYLEALKSATPELTPRLRFNLALAYYKSFQIPEAVAELEALHAAQPADLNLALLLADCYLRMGEFQKAIDAAEPLESSHAVDPGLNYVVGMAMIRLDRK